MENQEKLEDFIGKVLSTRNCGELGDEVLGVLRQWKDELAETEEKVVNEPEIKNSTT